MSEKVNYRSREFIERNLGKKSFNYGDHETITGDDLEASNKRSRNRKSAEKPNHPPRRTRGKGRWIKPFGPK